MSCFTWQQRNVDGWRFVGFMKDWILKNTGEESFLESRSLWLWIKQWASSHSNFSMFFKFNFDLGLLWLTGDSRLFQSFNPPAFKVIEVKDFCT